MVKTTEQTTEGEEEFYPTEEMYDRNPEPRIHKHNASFTISKQNYQHLPQPDSSYKYEGSKSYRTPYGKQGNR